MSEMLHTIQSFLGAAVSSRVQFTIKRTESVRAEPNEKIDQRVPTFDKTFFIKAEKNKNITSIMFLEQKDFVCYSFTNNVQVLFAESI